MNENDLLTLNGNNWLNDNVMYQCLKILTTENKSNFHFLDPLFYLCLEHGKDYTKFIPEFPESIFSYPNLIIPINIRKQHWAIAYFNRKTKSLIIYDPLSNREDVSNIKKRLETFFLEQASQSNLGFIYEDDIKVKQETLYPKQPSNDKSNCGIFILSYIKSIINKEITLQVDPPKLREEWRRKLKKYLK